MDAKLAHVDTVLVARETARVSWYNAKHSILLVEAWGQWSWEDAHILVAALQDHAHQQAHPVYTIYHSLAPEYMMPRGGNALVEMRRLMTTTPENEVLVCFVGMHKTIQTFLSVVSKAYTLSAIFSKYAFLNNLDDALQVIAAAQAKQAQVPPSP